MIPLKEQQDAVELFLGGGNLRIDAYAGTGKTTTLAMLSASTRRKGLYLAFNRAIALSARGRFSASVRATTIHSLALNQVQSRFHYPEAKFLTKLTPNLIADFFRFPTYISFRCGLVLTRFAYAAILLASINEFLRSSDSSVVLTHVSRSGILESLDAARFQSFAEQAVEHVSLAWELMLKKDGGVPLGHDGYLKLWALSNPEIRASYVLVDEAQDLNPVVLDVLNRWRTQLVYAGDPYQQIYDWRGAINAMDSANCHRRATLSHSFRFGPEIANAANTFLQALGARTPLEGSAKIQSHIAAVLPDVVLCRTNVAVVSRIIECVRSNVPCSVLGGTAALILLLNDVLRLRNNQNAVSSELLGFASWNDVVMMSNTQEGEHLRPLVSLVKEHGETFLLSVLGKCEVSPSPSGVVCSTAHKAKGTEWDFVHLDDDFGHALRRRKSQVKAATEAVYHSELRLFYTALTRGRMAVRIPEAIKQQFSLKNTSSELYGRRR